LNIDRAAGALLVGLPIAFNLFFFLLGRAFDYPGILRSPVGTILNRFQAGGAWPGIVVGALLVVGSLEFVGRFEEHGWKRAATIVPIAYTAWSLWLLATGVVLLI
jgi:hypothetical protein